MLLAPLRQAARALDPRMVAQPRLLRYREIGIRLALGASRPSIVSMVLRQLTAVGACGLTAGLALGMIVSQLLRTQPVYLQTPDWRAHAAAVLLFTIAGGLAAIWPVLTAVRGDAVAALRAE